jgi:tetratricopeptide (TPR) repeat protein
MNSIADLSNQKGVRNLRELFFELGLALSSHDRHVEAAQALEQALKEEGSAPDPGVLLFNLAIARERANQPGSAFQNYLEAIALAPRNMAEILPHVHELLTRDLVLAAGEWLDTRWNPDIEYADVGQAVKADFARLLGRINLYRDKYSSAAGFFQQALEIAPEDARVLEGLGEALFRAQRFEDAVSVLNRAHEIAAKGEFRERLMAIDAKLARVLVAVGQFQAALDRIAEALTEGDRFKDELLLSRSQCYLSLAQPDKALEAAEAAQQLQKASIEARLWRAQALIALGRYSDAVIVVDEALQYDPQRLDSLLHKAQALLEGQIDARQGRRLLERYAERAGPVAITPQTLPSALEARKADGNAQYFIAELYRAVGYPDQALKALEQALHLGFGPAPQYREAPAQQLKGELLEKSGQKDLAADFYYEAGRRFLWRGDYNTAIEQLRRAADLKPKHSAAYWYWADALRMLSYQTSLRLEERKAAIEESAEVWDKSAELGFPDRDNSWAYTVRACISEQLASLLATDLKQQQRRWWEGVAFLERALLVYEADADTWASLGRYHRFLSNQMNALRAAARAWELNPENLTVQEERAATLANVGELKAAEEAIDKRRAATPNVWADGVKAYILSAKGQYGEALELIGGAIDAEPENIWILDLRARCFRMLGDFKRAELDYRKIWGRYDEEIFDSQIIFGMAAYHLGNLEQAIKIFSDFPGGDDEITANWYLGASYLTQNKLPDADRHLARSAALAKSAREVDDLLREDLPGLQASSEGWPHKVQVREILERTRQRLEVRKVSLASERPPEGELLEALDGLALKGELQSWSWISVYAGLGRLHTTAERYDQAAVAYRMLLKYRQMIPEVGIGTQRVAAGFEAVGDRLLRSSELTAAIQQYRNGLDILSDDGPEGMAEQASLRGRLGLALFLQSDLGNARSEFGQLLRIHRQLGSEHPGEVLGEICRRLLNDPKQYWALEHEWNTYASAVNKDEDLHSDLVAARNSLTAFVVDWLERPVNSNSESQIPVVTPVVMEIGAGLIPADTSENWSLFKTYIPEMRARFENQMGVRVPGVRVRGNNLLPSDRYALLLDEHFVVGGNTYLQMRYSPAALSALLALGVPETALRSSSDPLTGQRGYWVPQECWGLIRGHNLDLWEEPLVFVVRHLEAVLRRNLADFLGVQEVENMLEVWGESEEGSALIKKVLPDERTRLRFARVLRTLVREQVPITEWKEIVASAQASGLENLEGAVRAARIRLKEHLPGNDSRTRRFEIPAEWKSILDSWIKRSQAGSFFDPPAEQSLRFLSMVGNLLQSDEANAALVVDSHECRPFVRRLVESRFPFLMILSTEELLSRDTPATSAA